ncbi:di-heme oxidoredictase family protein [Stenomitos frigidus]|uniref:Cytochrome c domain-containing protein n=1 Tax=Stenomitos frigidus ULC18 TaxID=2107698 RepID=A0A2T1E1H8_9CYAN|nr:di-heme oxidoredictase family protein [Stenomitos frigidus]PSB26474.1 hypothetical protein C7B82_19565 [Stenomitos frigidus ULC18]
MRHRRLLFFLLTIFFCCTGILLSSTLVQAKVLAISQLLAPAPPQPLGFYDYFGKLLSPEKAARLAQKRGLDPNASASYQSLGAVEITQPLIDQGEQIFFNRKIGDTFGLQGVLGFGQGLQRLLPEIQAGIQALQGQPTSNLVLTLQNDLTLGSRTFPAGTLIPTGLDVPGNAPFPLGLSPTGNLTCAICHVVVSPQGAILKGAPNNDLGAQILIALAPNTAAGFARLNFDPLDPKFKVKGTGKTIMDSHGQTVQLPDPDVFEQAFDDAVLAVPYGNFESSPDRIDNTTGIPNVFTFKSGPYTAGGEFAVGPFAGASAISNGVHSSEINVVAAYQLAEQALGIDPEVYLGTILQNAAVPQLRLPDGAPVKPSEWLRQIAPNPKQAELEDQFPLPGAGEPPNVRPSLLSYNGLFFSPDANKPNDSASGTFMFAANAMAAFQNSLVPPPNRSTANQLALESGSVERGAKVFKQANCATCHIPPFFTDNQIHPLQEIKTNPARAQSRLGLKGLLVAPQMYSLNTPVPVPAGATVLDVPTEGIASSPTSLPNGLLPNGGYKTTSLRGVYLSPPYLHDSGVAVRAGAIAVSQDQLSVTDPSGLGLTGTLSQSIPADAANSLRALVDRDLRRQVVAANKADPRLVFSNLDGTGHRFYVDRKAGYSMKDQTDLVNFLLALDDHPSDF